MNNISDRELKELEKRYQERVQQLGKTSWISEGYVQHRGPGYLLQVENQLANFARHTLEFATSAHAHSGKREH